MRENRLLHLFRVGNIVTLVNKLCDVSFDSCSHTISWSLPPWGSEKPTSATCSPVAFSTAGTDKIVAVLW